MGTVLSQVSLPITWDANKNANVMVLSQDQSLSDPYLIDQLMTALAWLTPCDKWSAYACVCKAWRASAHRVFPQIYQELYSGFAGKFTHPTIQISGDRSTILKKITETGYMWAFTGGIPVVTRAVHEVSMTHTVRVGGGGFVALFASTKPPTTNPARLHFEQSGFIKNVQPAEDSEWFLISLGTVSGAIEFCGSKGFGFSLEPASPKRLESPQGTEFWLRFDVARKTLRFATRRSDSVHATVTVKLPRHTKELPQNMKIYWAASLFCPKTIFTLKY